MMRHLPDLDLMLDLHLETWQAVPETLDALRAWDEDERLDFLAELTPEDQSLTFLAEQAAQGAMTPAQLIQFAEVEALVSARRAVLDAYLAESSGPLDPARVFPAATEQGRSGR